MKEQTLTLSGKRVLITGAAGFIGASLAKKLCETVPDITVIGVDNLNDYYDTALKEARIGPLYGYDSFSFVKGSIGDKELIDSLFRTHRPDIVVNLAAQAGVRYSIVNPEAYIETNLVGFFHILEACRNYPVEHLVFASSSSVYGSNSKIPYSVEDPTEQPVSLYAATKKSDELMAYAYSKLYEIPSTGLRFFTVYGPEGRPDMAYFQFTDKLLRGEPIRLFNYGKCQRDFTYIDDITEGLIRILPCPPQKSRGSDGLPIPPYAVYNLGNHKPEELMEFVKILQEELIRAGLLPEAFDGTSLMELVPMQPGDVAVTYADTESLERDFGFQPSTSLREGLRKFVEWYQRFYSRERRIGESDGTVS